MYRLTAAVAAATLWLIPASAHAQTAGPPTAIPSCNYVKDPRGYSYCNTGGASVPITVPNGGSVTYTVGYPADTPTIFITTQLNPYDASAKKALGINIYDAESGSKPRVTATMETSGLKGRSNTFQAIYQAGIGSTLTISFFNYWAKPVTFTVDQSGLMYGDTYVPNAFYLPGQTPPPPVAPAPAPGGVPVPFGPIPLGVDGPYCRGITWNPPTAGATCTSVPSTDTLLGAIADVCGFDSGECTLMEDPRFIVFYDANLALEPDLGGYVKEGSPFVVHISPDELFDRKETAAVLVHELTHTGQNMAGRHEDTYQHCLDMEGEAYTAQQQFLMSNYGTSFVDPIPQAAAADCNTHTW